MENNKILIGICFYDNNDKNINEEIYSVELLVLHDITFQTLYDGIKWGFEVKKENDLSNQLFENLLKNLSKYDIYIANHIRNEKEIEPYKLGKEEFGKKICDLGFVSSTRVIFCTKKPNFNTFIGVEKIIEAFKIDNINTDIKFPKYNISSRLLKKLNDTPIDIIPPSEPPKKSTQPFFMLILPSLLLIGVTILVRGRMSDNANMMMLSISMALVTLVSTLINYWYQERKHKEDLKIWKDTYTKYIDDLLVEISKRRSEASEKLNEIYPDLHTILGDSKVFSLNKDIFSRSPQDDDFLTVRLGISSQVEVPFKINGDKKNVLFSQATFTMNSSGININLSEDNQNNNGNFLCNLPNKIAKENQYLDDAPLLLPLKNCGTLGVVNKNTEYSKQLVDNIIFELCYYHSPEDLQIIMLFNEIPMEDIKRNSKIEEQINMYKFMPHFRNVFNDKSPFVFDKESANSVFSALLEMMNIRQNNPNEKFPHIVLVIYEEYGLKEHAFAKYLPQPPQNNKPYVDTLGITFIFVKKYEEHLPNYCSQTIVDDNKEDENGSISNSNIYFSLKPRENSENQKHFSFFNANNTITINNANNNKDIDIVTTMRHAYELLSTLNYSKISQNSKVPSNVSIYEIFNISGNAENNNLKDILKYYWYYKPDKSNPRVSDVTKIKDVTKSLAVPIGKTEDKVTYLDLHEKSDGPHMLVAGTTGSGKSETIISYLVALCIKFRPDEINLMLVDMKGEGFVGRIGDLPHVVGKVTDVDGDDSGTGAEYMLRRFLESLTSEIKRRKLLFKKMCVDSIDKYISACNDIYTHIKDNLSGFVVENGKTVSTLLEENVTIDEMCERNPILKAMKEISIKQKLTHLILVVDEFTELKRFSSENSDVDFIGEITTIARIGRSLGLHIILISQNIEGAITDDIRVNSKARLCLKVATRMASKEMIHTDLAASPSMPGNGRAYLLVGTGSRFEYFQSAYSGASASSNSEIPVEFIEASKSGKYTTFYSSSKDNKDLIEKAKNDKKTQLSVIVETIKEYYEHEKTEGNLYEPHIVFQPPLPKKAIYKDGHIIDIS